MNETDCFCMKRLPIDDRKKFLNLLFFLLARISPCDASAAVGRVAEYRMTDMMQMHANRQEMIEEIHCGDIGAAVGLSETTTGDTICDQEHPIILEAIEFPAPVISVSITPESRDDQGENRKM